MHRMRSVEHNLPGTVPDYERRVRWVSDGVLNAILKATDRYARFGNTRANDGAHASSVTTHVEFVAAVSLLTIGLDDYLGSRIPEHVNDVTSLAERAPLGLRGRQTTRARVIEDFGGTVCHLLNRTKRPDVFIEDATNLDLLPLWALDIPRLELNNRATHDALHSLIVNALAVKKTSDRY